MNILVNNLRSFEYQQRPDEDGRQKPEGRAHQAHDNCPVGRLHGNDVRPDIGALLAPRDQVQDAIEAANRKEEAHERHENPTSKPNSGEHTASCTPSLRAYMPADSVMAPSLRLSTNSLHLQKQFYALYHSG